MSTAYKLIRNKITWGFVFNLFFRASLLSSSDGDKEHSQIIFTDSEDNQQDTPMYEYPHENYTSGNKGHKKEKNCGQFDIVKNIRWVGTGTLYINAFIFIVDKTEIFSEKLNIRTRPYKHKEQTNNSIQTIYKSKDCTTRYTKNEDKSHVLKGLQYPIYSFSLLYKWK